MPFDQVVDQSSGGNRRALIGGLIGGLLAVILLVALLAWIVVREKRRNRENQEPIDVHPQPQAIDAAPSTSIGMYDPAQPTPVATKRNMYTAAPRSTPAELLANYGSTPEPSNFDVRGDNNRYDRAPEAKALYNV